MVLQGTGSASAASVESLDIPSIKVDLLATITSAKVALGATMVGALLTGQMNQYQAMHDTPPDFSVLKFHKQADLSHVRMNNAATSRLAYGTRLDAPNGMAQMRPPRVKFAAASQPAAASRSLRVFQPQTATLLQRGATVVGSTARAQNVRTMSVDTTVASTTGINKYWEYEEGAIPAAGKYMVNVASGNVIVQGDDIDIPGRGIDLAFRRTYNSGSKHDWGAQDGSTVGNYGGGWTNNFDSHLGYDPTHSVISWYDIDGARYDYACSGTTCTPPAGQYATMTYDGGCGYWITKKIGTAYHFWAPTFNSTITPGCSLSPTPYGGVLGRVVTIWARNQANTLQFTYSWDGGDSSSASHLAQILVSHSDGQSLTLTFGDVNSQRVLLSILRPDGNYVRYGYDSAIELSDVCVPGNGTTDSSPGASTICGDSSHIHHRYGYTGGYNGHQIAWADSPNFTMSWGASASNGFVNFAFDGSNRVTTIDLMGIFNFAPSDGTGTYLSPSAPTGTQLLTETNYAYTSGLTTVTDTDGHSTKYTYDGQSRATARQAWQGTMYLTSGQTWDASDNLTTSTDERGYVTDYAYDANGNTIAVALPSVTTNVGTFQPTKLLSYDSYSNVVASCDPASVGASGYDWVDRPTDSHCATHAGRTTFTWGYGDEYEPFGLLSEMQTPLGYHRQYQYNPSAQGGDFGQPTDVTGDPIIGQEDGTSRTPHQSFTYDSHGNLVSYSAGNGAWTLVYDTENRMISARDGDGYTSYTCYQLNGQVFREQSPAQYGADGTICGSSSVSHSYDADGNELTKVRHFGNVAGTTQNWYDGADRLVEVALPHDSSDVYSYHWQTRNIYDLSENGPLTAATVSGIYAHGNLYKTQEYVGVSSPQWTDLKADAYDALDRQTVHYQYQSGTGAFTHATQQYDATTATWGLLSQKTDALGEVTTYTYDNDGKSQEVSYAGDGGVTPSETMGYDPDGRVVSMLSSSMGTLTEAYDADGRETGVQEASGGGVTSPATYTYGYYADGMKKSLSVNSTALAQTNLLQYSYRTDGQRDHLAFADGATAASMTWTLTAAGRVQSIADSSGQSNRVFTRDAYGQVQLDQMPSGTTSGITRDVEGEMTGFTSPSGAATIGYSVRGEFEKQTYTAYPCSGSASDPELNPLYQRSANGYMVGQPGDTGGCFWDTSAATWDYRTGAATGNDSGGANTTIAYDLAGRQTTSTQSYSWETPSGQGENYHAGSGTKTRSYDAEDHLIADNVTTWDDAGGALSGCLLSVAREELVPNIDSAALSYAWGPNGHPDLWNTSDTLHWDGDTPLFVTTSAGVAELKVEGLGYYVPGSTFKFLDRNGSGFVVAAHWSGGHSAYTPADSQHQTCSGSDLSGAVLFEPGSDGIGDGINVIQGVRAYDPGTGQWTSPDAFAGNAGDPVSQKSFMWNGNNSLGYSDPSGYDAISDAINDTEAGITTVMDPAADVQPGCGTACKDADFETAMLGTAFVFSAGMDGPQLSAAFSEDEAAFSSAADIVPATQTINRYVTAGDLQSSSELNQMRGGAPGTVFATTDAPMFSSKAVTEAYNITGRPPTWGTTSRVAAGTFSSETKVAGGTGFERTAEGPVNAVIIRKWALGP